MLFNSFQFLLFFPIVTVIYFLLPHQWRWLHLLLASCVFYMAFVPVYILILFFTIIIDYIAGIMIESTHGPQRKSYLVMSIIANVGVLCIFKYYNFFADNINELLSHITGRAAWNMPFLNILLPIGLSFHTFQAMSYTIEVFRGNQKAERHFGIYALYVMFFPQLVAGPIERPQNMLHQFHEKHYLDTANLAKGLRLMLWGFFMKVVIADRLAIYVNAVYNNAPNHNGTSILLAAVYFAFQIYCDFAGYSYIAIGCAKTMGFNLMTNFNYPFRSKNPTEFWRRWHISLSTWFNDYLFTPLVVNKRDWGKSGVAFALMCTFLISGLWHGAGWTFIIWGALQGIACVYEFFTRKLRKKLAAHVPTRIYNLSSQLLTFCFLVFTWIFFRASNLSAALLIIKKIATSRGPVFGGTNPYALFGILILVLVELKEEYFAGRYLFFENPNIYIRYISYTVAVVAIMLLGVFDGGQFIYFQF
jgi:alginate O-acetyltransferase complex protein AlgI